MINLCIILSLMLISAAGWASPPPCYPGDATSDRPFSAVNLVPLPKIVIDDANCAAVWFCDGGGKWLRQSIYGHGEECNYSRETAIAQLIAPRVVKDSIWNSVFTSSTPNPLDDDARNLALSVPLPDFSPPSGLVTTGRVVYKMTTAANSAPVFSEIGTVALGVPCDVSAKFGPYYRIDRATVKFPAGALMPPVTYAKCD